MVRASRQREDCRKPRIGAPRRPRLSAPATVKAFDDLIALQQKVGVDDAGSDRGAAHVSDRNVVIAFVVLAVLIAALVAFLITRSIVTPDAAAGRDHRRRQQGRLHAPHATASASDEFGTLAARFNRMTDELTRLVGQVQKSGIQVNTSVTEIAATAKQQQATASEIAATTTEIGATSKEISATSKELVRTMNEVSDGRRADRRRWPAAARPA